VLVLAEGTPVEFNPCQMVAAGTAYGAGTRAANGHLAKQDPERLLASDLTLRTRACRFALGPPSWKGAQIRKARELLGWAPSRLAQRAKLHSAIVQRAESVDGEPPITVFQHALIRDTLERFGIEFAGIHECDVKMRQVGKAENDER
jgi:hypothetical protein